MSKGVNKATILGRIGKDPEIKVTPSGLHIANFSVATSEKWKDKDSGEWKDRTEWHRIVMFSKLAEIVGEYVKKGDQVYIEGKLQTRKWEDKEVGTRYTTEIVGNDLQMLGSRKDSGADKMATVLSGKKEHKTAVDEPFDDSIPF